MANDIEDIRLNGTRYGINDERLAKKAEIDGYYEEMTVGDAEQLVSTKYVNDAEPYNFRTTGGSADVGNREYLDKIVGGTVAWNQLVNPSGLPATTTKNGVTFTNNGDGTLTLSGTADATFAQRVVGSFTQIQGHKYFVYSPNLSSNLRLYDGFSQDGYATESGGIIYYNRETNNQGTIYAYVVDDTIFSSLTIKVICIDLTQMFGATIADYIYSLEQAAAGAGAAFFRKLFPKTYYAYNTGELISVKTSAHNTVGFNQWDEQWEVGAIDNSTGQPQANTNYFRAKNYINVLPSVAYYFKSDDYLYVYGYDAEQNFIGVLYSSIKNTTKTLPNNCYYIKFVDVSRNSYNNDISINLSWSGWRNGEYEPYVKHEYALDSDLELRGIPKLDASNNLYYDGDEYQSDGTVTRRYNKRTFDGTEAWGKEADTYNNNGLPVFFLNINTDEWQGKMPSQTELANMISSNWLNVSYTGVRGSDVGNVFSQADSGRWFEVVQPAGTTLESFKSSLATNPVTVVYEKYTPTTETADAYNEMQICDDFGTEEFVDTRDVPVPVGHETRYPANLRDKLQHLPDLADADGYYMIQQSNHAMSLIRFRIPQAPAEDGEYTLKATVSGGTPTYTWESTESEG